MDVKSKWIIGVFTTLLVAVVSFVVYKFWIPIQSFFTGKSYYTEQEAQELYDKGLKDGDKKGQELQSKIDYYIQLVDSIPALESQIDSLNTEVDQLKLDKEVLYNRYSSLTKEHTDCEETRSNLLEQISDLSTSIAEKEDLITSLEMEKIVLTTQIAEYSAEINKLQQDLDYYEQYLYSNLDSDKVVAKFMLDDSVYAIQVLNVNSIASIEDPTSTDYIIFNYWTIDGVSEIDLSTHTLTENTTFIANIDRYYDVNFNIDGNITTQLVKKGSISTIPTSTPTKDGYVFVGYTLDGNTLVDVNTYEITSNTTFIAKFTRLNLVEFYFDGKVISTQSIKTGEYAEPVNTNISDKIIFNYWTIDGVRVDMSTYPIMDYTQVIANITKLYDVKFNVEGSLYTSSILEAGSTISAPTNPTKTGYRFDGWYLNDTKVDFTTYVLNSDVTFVARFIKVYEVTFMVNSEIYNKQSVTSSEFATSPNNPSLNGCKFIGWSINGVDVVDVSKYSITENLVFVAVFDYGMDGEYTYDCYYAMQSLDILYDTYKIVIKNGEIVSQEYVSGYIDGKRGYDVTFNEIVGNQINVNIQMLGAENVFVDTLTYDFDTHTWSNLLTKEYEHQIYFVMTRN